MFPVIFGALAVGTILFLFTGKAHDVVEDLRERKTAEDINDDQQLSKLVAQKLPKWAFTFVSNYLPTENLGLKADKDRALEIARLIVRIKKVKDFSTYFYNTYKIDVSDALKNYLEEPAYLIVSNIMTTADTNRHLWIEKVPSFKQN